MTNFFLDLWHDLRAKRLWPVAVGLAVAIIAVPVVLTKSSSGPATPPSQPVEQKTAHLPAVNLDPTSVASSHLDVFKERNPFKGLADNTGTVLGATGTTVATGSPAGTGTSGSATGGSGATTGSSGSASKASSGSGGGGSSSGGSSGSSSQPSAPDGNPVTPGLHFYVFTVDVRFGQTGHVHSYNGVRQLDLLPPSKRPILVFMGAKDGGKTAVFFNPSALRATGEGKCVAGCEFLYMKKDQEETLFDSGHTEYTLKLNAVHVQEVSKDEAAGSTTPSKNVSAASKRQERTLLAVPSLAFKR